MLTLCLPIMFGSGFWRKWALPSRIGAMDASHPVQQGAATERVVLGLIL